VTVPGDETRQFKKDIEEVIRDMAGEVTDVRITQATLCTKSDNMHKDVKKINGRLTKVEDKTDDLESSRDKNRGMIRVFSWVGGFLIGLPSLTYGIIKVVEWIKP
jgi:uncharacterized protein YpuA (DUF1002 family)